MRDERQQTLELRWDNTPPNRVASVALLSSHVHLTDLIGRDREIQDLLNWCNDSDVVERIRLLSGPGGSGKTRLAAELAHILKARNEGWDAGFLETEEQFVVSDGPALIIVDYPEERRSFTQDVFSAIRHLPKARLLLLTRLQLPAWLAEIGSAHCGHLVAQQQMMLPRLAADDAVRLYVAVRRKLAAKAMPLKLPKEQVIRAWVSRDAALHSLPLYVTAAALYGALNPDSPLGFSGREVVRALVSRELDSRLAAASIAAGFKREAASRLAAIAFARGGLDEQTVVRLSDPKLGIGLSDPYRVADDVRGLPWWEENRWPAMSPDVVGAVLLFEVFNQRPMMAPEWFWTAVDGAGVDIVGRLGRILYDIRTIYGDEHIDAWRGDRASVLAEWLVTMVQRDPLRARTLSFIIDDEHLPLGLNPVAIAVAEALLALHPPSDQRGRILRALSLRLREAGKPDEAMRKVLEAVTIYADLAKADPERFEADRARCLTTFSEHLSDSGDRVGALNVIREAVDIWERRAESEAELKSDLAASLLYLSFRHLETGDRPAAIAQNRAAVNLYRQLAAEKPERFEAEFARSLVNLGERLSANNPSEALELINQAIQIRRQLADREPARYEIDLGSSLTAYARVLGMNDPSSSLPSIGEAVGIIERHAKVEPARFAGDFADALVDLADLRSRAGHDRLTVLEPLLQAVKIYREFAPGQPGRFNQSLAWALYDVANLLRREGEIPRALTQISEAVNIFDKAADNKTVHWESSDVNSLTYPSWRFRNSAVQTQSLVSALKLYGELLRASGDNDAAQQVSDRVHEIGARSQELRSPPAAASSTQSMLLLPDPQHTEVVRSEPLDQNRYLIVDVPVFTQSYGYRDVVEASDVGGTLVAGTIVEAGRYSTYALEATGDSYSKEALRRLREIEDAGSAVEFRGGTICSIAADTAHREEVEQQLKCGMADGLWTANLIRRVF